MASSQKSALLDVFNERNRPSWSKTSLNKVYIVSRSFVNEWRAFVRAQGNKPPVTHVGNAVLLCECKKLLYPLGLDTESDYESTVFMVSEEEWRLIRRFFTVDTEISAVRRKVDVKEMIVNGSGNRGEEDLLLTTEPEVCKECVRRRREMEEQVSGVQKCPIYALSIDIYSLSQERLCYQNVPVFVRRLLGGEKAPSNGNNNGEEVNDDPDFAQGIALGNGHTAPANKKAKLANGEAADGDNGHVRRSARRQKVRGEREINVSSTTTLKEFKVRTNDDLS